MFWEKGQEIRLRRQSKKGIWQCLLLVLILAGTVPVETAGAREDKNAPVITMIPAEANENGYYSGDVPVEIVVEDALSGIRKVEYRITSGGEETLPYEELYCYREGEEIPFAYRETISVKAEANDSAEVNVWIRVTSQDGSVYITEEGEVCRLKICTAKPVVEVSIDGVLHREAKEGYYNAQRKAVVTITDRADVFDAEAASRAILIGKNEEQPCMRPAMVSAWTDQGDRHTAVVTFDGDGTYTWKLSAYTNRAGLCSDGVRTAGDSPYTFTVDTEPPLTSDIPDRDASWIGFGEKGWSRLAASIRFGTWERKAVTVAAEGKDAVSPVYAAKYYKTNGTEIPALGKDALDALYERGAFTESPYTVEDEKQFAVYARITDYAGNTAYISTEGVTVDMTAGEVALSALDQPNAAGIYNDDVRIDVRANDSLGEQKAYAGIRTVSYTIKNPETQYTETGNLYTFDKENPERGELRQEWAEADLIVDAEKFNAGGILVTVTVTDNAGNESSDSMSLNICRNAPEMTVAFHDTANKIADGRGYFGQMRKAVVTVRDREDVFDEESVKVMVSAVDSGGVLLLPDESVMTGAWSHEGDIHTMTVSFAADGNYELSLSYVNRADLSADVSYEGTTPQKFTVDTTAPRGTVTIQKHTWRELLSTLTFGLYSNMKAEVTAKAEDATSPVIMEYYKTDHPAALTPAQLEQKKFEPYPENGFTVSSDEQLVIYLKVTDYAGNYVYVSSDGYIVDMTKSGISLIPETEKEHGIYKQDVKVAVRIQEPEPYSGIKTVRYEVKNQGKRTQSGMLYAFEKERPLQSELLRKWEGAVIIDAQKNNSCNVAVSVFVKDNAGNESQESITLDIDVTRPDIKIVYTDDEGKCRNGYFSESRTAVVTITERTHHFDRKSAVDGIKIRAVDAKGKAVAVDKEAMFGGWVTTEGETPDEAVHTAAITYEADANYTVSVSYTDKAGNHNTAVDAGNSAAPWEFTVDQTAPTGIVTARRAEGSKGTQTVTWDNELVDNLRFGFWSGKTITVTGKAFDDTSPVASIRYYKTGRRTAMTERELRNLAEEEWKDFRKKRVKIVPNEQAAVYVEIMDMAGNVSYISSDGMIADKDKPRAEYFAPQITLHTEEPVNGFYHGDVKVKLTVRDFNRETKEPYSGLKTVRYEVLSMGERTQGGIEDGNPEGVLYSFEKTNPGQKELKKSWSGVIKVDSRKNNSNQVVIKIYAEDNAGNTAAGKKTIKIDITTPQVSIRYDNNSPDSGKYYNSDRTATITVTERNFDEKDVAVMIRNSAGVIPAVTGWKEIKGSGNGDDAKHIASVTYHADGDYTFGIRCTDLAGNGCPGAVYAAGTENPAEFTIDQTPPVIAVRYDNNQAQNGRYFKERRTGTVTITEHNFDKSRVKFIQTASLRGNAIAVPQASWSSRGDVHTAVFSYAEDGDYTFDAVMTDLAGNRSAGISCEDAEAGAEFTIDTGIEKLEITGVENGKSYQGEVLPFIDYEDANFSGKEIRLLRTRKNEKDVDVTAEFLAGAAGTHIFEKTEENDGIYTLFVKISDLAGNEETEKVIFTVNRFGSVYVFDDYLASLRDAYTQEVKDNLVVTEYNPDRLAGDSADIQITRDGVPLKHVKYTVTPMINDKVTEGESGWYQYKYEIDAGNFKEDGIYKLSIASKDMAGNRPETAGYGNGDVLFRVDTTPPEITDITGLEKFVVNKESQDVKFEIFDSVGLKQITVYVDDIKAGIYHKLDNRIRYSSSITIQEGAEQKVRFVAEDLAGNVIDTDARDKNGRYIFQPEFAFVRTITVSTSAFVRWYADKKLFWAVFGGMAAVGGVFLGRRKFYGEKES